MAFRACGCVGDVEAICIAYKAHLHSQHLTVAAQALARVAGRRAGGRVAPGERAKVGGGFRGMDWDEEGGSCRGGGCEGLVLDWWCVSGTGLDGQMVACT